MKITGLGHSSYILEMMAPAGLKPFRLLADPWLDDYIIGDLQGRFPRLHLDAGALGDIDAIFLSHSHTDHLDPYSLVRLWRELEPRPSILLPQSLLFLENLLRQYLDGVELIILREDEHLEIRGISIEAFFNPETSATNEDDVMVLVAGGDHEVFLAESDAVLPLYHPDMRDRLTSLFSGEEIETACFLTIKNEGTASMSMLAARSQEDRRRRFEQCIEETYNDINEIYASPDLEIDGLWMNEKLVRVITGQGICYPQALGEAWNRVLFPIRIEDRVRMEREVAGQYECFHSIEELIPGVLHLIEGGQCSGRQPVPGIEVLDRVEDRRFDGSIALFESFPVAPLRDGPRDIEVQRQAITSLLGDRFLPHLIGSRQPPVEHLLAQNGGLYRIRIRFGTTEKYTERDFILSFDHLRFREGDPHGDPDEWYWANDLEDVLDGRSDEFSLFCRHPLPARAQRLWLCLGLPYLNNDLIEKKLRGHFERAARGESLEEWVLGFWQSLPRCGG